jgi:hypothetical protein
MSTKIKIYIGMAVLIIAIFTYQYFVIKSLKTKLDKQNIEISVLEQNEQALKDSIEFIPDSIAILHTFITGQEQLTKELTDMYNDIKDKSDKDIKNLKQQVGLLSAEVEFKNQIIGNLQQNMPNIGSTDSTITIPILYNNTDMGLTLDGKAVGNFIDKTGYVYWNKIETKLPKLRIGLTYNEQDTTIVALIESNNVIQSVKTVMSDRLFELIVRNNIPKKSILDYIGILTEIEYSNNPIVNMQVFGYYKNFYITAGKRLDVYENLKSDNIYRIGYFRTINSFIK